MKSYLIIPFLLLAILPKTDLEAQQLSSSEIYHELQKFNFLGSVLYVAAHPDDENTRLISHLSNGLYARTAYLSLTRGDGGQNLIGTEIRELLGVIRSQELQMARATDGGQQFFTRANDFGYSKHPDETLEIWNKDEVFADLVYTVRAFKPDIIINRFDHRTPGKTHGHHTSSAMLSVEAFDKVGDPSVFPEQLTEVDVWQPTRQFMNTSWWFYGSRENFAKADKTNLIGIDAGLYYGDLGISNNEISALARSKHRSQGFGSSGSRGSYQEYLELLNGDMPADKQDLFGDINTTWDRVEGGAGIKRMTDALINNFNFQDPSQNLDALLDIYDQVSKLKDGHWKKVKLPQLQNLIVQCSGLFLEAATDMQQVTHGDSLEIRLEATSRSSASVTLKDVSINGRSTGTTAELEPFTDNKYYQTILIDKSYQFSNPYWLNEEGRLGTYKIDKMSDRILPQSPGPIAVVFDLDINGRVMSIEREAIYRYANPAVGEIREPLVVIPPATMSFDKDIYLNAQEGTMPVNVKVRSGADKTEGTLKIQVPEGWSISPKSQEVSIKGRGFEQSYTFELKAPNNTSTGEINAVMSIGGQSYDRTLINIDYDHIPLQTILLPAKSRVVKVPMGTGGKNIGYVMGAGDKMPESLRNVGYTVSLLELEDVASQDLSSYDAIVIGIRAYNTLKTLKLYNKYLFQYAEKGGTLVTQYNTSRRINFDDIAPYPIKLSRKRVTDEFAEMRIVNADHLVLNTPNKITKDDFDGWVQERGLYFAEEWDDAYASIVSCNDKGEDPLEGSLLVAPHGEGHFVYTSISWFRQLPAGVPGAYRLFSNILALSSDDK